MAFKALSGGVEEDKKVLWGLAAWDGFQGIALGFYLGAWGGRVVTGL